MSSRFLINRDAGHEYLLIINKSEKDFSVLFKFFTSIKLSVTDKVKIIKFYYSSGCINEHMKADVGWFCTVSVNNFLSFLCVFTMNCFNYAEGTLKYLPFKGLLIKIGCKLLDLLTDKSGPVLSKHLFSWITCYSYG